MAVVVIVLVFCICSRVYQVHLADANAFATSSIRCPIYTLPKLFVTRKKTIYDQIGISPFCIA